jgi:uncharacterized membrane protein YphA (DoxX/SURF4 family)
MNDRNLKKLAPWVLRLGFVIVFTWFGYHQITNQAMWLSFIPSWATSMTGQTAQHLVIANGTFELIMAFLLLIGWRVRLIATLLFLHMIAIVSHIGFTATGIRDFGIMCTMLYMALRGRE